MKLESKIGKFYIITPAGEKIGPPKTPEEIQLVTQVYFPEPGTKLEEAETGVTFTWEEFVAEFLVEGVLLHSNAPKKEAPTKKLLNFFSVVGLVIVLAFSFVAFIVGDTIEAFGILFFGGASIMALQIYRRFF